VDVVDHPDMLPVLLAMWSVGAVAVLVDPEWGPGLRETVLRHSRADLTVAVAAGGGTPGVAPARVAHPLPTRPPLPPDTAIMAFTSGSTGSPKAIPIRHERLTTVLLSTAAAVTAHRGAPPRRIGSSMRFSGYGVLVLHFLWSAAFGAETVVLPRLELSTAGRYWAHVDEHRIDQAVLVPPLYELLLRASSPGGRTARPLFLNSSGPLAATTHARFQERFGCTVLNCYGLTETTFACAPGDLSAPGTSTPSIGPGHLARLRLRAADGSLVRGEGVGELEVLGPAVSDGYYDNDAANADLFRDGWIRTGDLVRRTEDRRHWVVGRLKDAVMKGGHTVYLNEIEDACLAVDAVAEAVAVRIDLPGGAEDVAVVARRRPGTQLEPAALSRRLRHHLGAERSPRRVLVVDEPLPRIGQDKPDRAAAARLWEFARQPAPVPGAASEEMGR
jgi:acyl-CoA synthetase (AMP-forming)/AMP-acid ligase II